jgi:hypothetical protein
MPLAYSSPSLRDKAGEKESLLKDNYYHARSRMAVQLNDQRGSTSQWRECHPILVESSSIYIRSDSPSRQRGVQNNLVLVFYPPFACTITVLIQSAAGRTRGMDNGHIVGRGRGRLIQRLRGRSFGICDFLFEFNAL